MKLNFANMFSEYVNANKKDWAHDRTKTVGASEVFQCLRQTWFVKRGLEFKIKVQTGTKIELNGVDIIDGEEIPHYDEVPVFADMPKYPEDIDADEETWGAMQRGNILEAHFVVPTIRDHLPKGKLVWGGDEQKTLFHNHNSATPDGLIIGLDRDALADYGIPDIKGHCIVVEIKSIDPRVRLDEAKDVHAGQARTQLGIIHEKTIYKPMYAVILYIDASFLDKISVFIVEYDKEIWEVAQQRADTIYNVDEPELIPAEGKITKECQFCPFQRTCAVVTNGTIPEDYAKLAAQNEQALIQFDHLVEQHEDAREASEASAHDLTVAKQKIKDALVDLGSRKIGGKPAKRPWSVSWSSQEGQNRLDTKALEATLGDLSPFKTQGNPFDVLRVTFAKEKP